MPQSLAKVLLHVVFSTKNRHPWLKDAGLRQELFAYMATALRAIECPALIIGGVEDHIHLLVQLSRKVAIQNLVEEVKTGTSKWLKSKSPSLHDFYWQSGYGAFSVSESKVDEMFGGILPARKNTTGKGRSKKNSENCVSGMARKLTNGMFGAERRSIISPRWG